MGRRCPGAVRALTSTTYDSRTPPVMRRRLPEMSPRVAAELHRRGHAETFASAYWAWRTVARCPDRSLWDNAHQWPDCPCCDPFDARDTLKHVIDDVPQWARGSLIRLVAPLDRSFRSRTWPGPRVPERPWTGWWRSRLR